MHSNIYFEGKRTLKSRFLTTLVDRMGDVIPFHSEDAQPCPLRWSPNEKYFFVKKEEKTGFSHLSCETFI